MDFSKQSLNKILKELAQIEKTTPQKIREQIEESIINVYNSRNIKIQSLSKDEKIPTIEEVFAYLLKHI